MELRIEISGSDLVRDLQTLYNPRHTQLHQEILTYEYNEQSLPADGHE